MSEPSPNGNGELPAASTTTPTPPTANDLPTAAQEGIPDPHTGPAAATAAEDQVIHPTYAKAAAENPEVAAAVELNKTFNPGAGVDYTWVVKHAREQFALADAAFKAADEKASSVIGYLGSGAGIFALGSIAGLAANQLSPTVALFSVPALSLAGLSLAFAALARRPFDAAYPPDTAAAISRAHWHASAADAEASLASIWHLATTLLQHATNKKAEWTRSATWMFVAAIGCLLFPLVAALYEKLPTGYFSGPAMHASELAPAAQK